ncbi:MAG: response regulator [Spirochaetota bacterium]
MSHKILIIDDEDTMRVSIQKVLQREGYDVKAFDNGREALEEIPKFLPDLILCDIVMPGVDGFEVLDKVRKYDYLLHTPFLFLSVRDDIEDIREGMNLGADDYLVKPFDKFELLNAIKIRLERLQQLVNTEPSPVGSKKIFLLVDDEPFHHINYKSLLKEIKPEYRYISFVNPEKAVNYLFSNKDQVRCIFLDLVMPGLDGRSFLSTTKALLEKSEIDVYLLASADSKEEEENDDLRSSPGVKRIIQKPLTKESIMEIAEVLT